VEFLLMLLTLGRKFGILTHVIGRMMKAFLQNLLIFFALSLCAMISYQWVVETDLRKQVQGLSDTVHDKLENIQSLQSNVKRDEGEIVRLDGLKTALTQTVKSNDLQISALVKAVEKATNEVERQEKQMEVYKGALDSANENIKKQNDDIKTQNEEMAKLAADRNEVVKKFNKMAADYNDLAAKWNKQQEELAKAATNAPPPKKEGSK
jgi:chromosome segregation ATPase